MSSDLSTFRDAVYARLQQFDMTSYRKGYRLNSPLRPGSNSHAFSLDPSDDLEKTGGWIWYDFVEERGGDAFDLAPILGIPLPERAAPLEAPKTFTNLDEYAAWQIGQTEHYTPGDWFRQFGWSDGTWASRRAAIIRTNGGSRARLLDGAKPKYMSRNGFTQTWYHLEWAVEGARELKSPLVLCNGEASVVVAGYFSVPATCLAGGGEHGINAERMAELKHVWDGKVIVAFDSDAHGKKAAEAAVVDLKKAGFDAYAVDLLGGKGFDLANWCKLYREEACERLLRQPPMVLGGEGGKVVETLLDENRVLKARLEAALQENDRLRKENDELRARNQFVTKAQGAPGIKSATLRDTIVELKKEVETAPGDDRMHEEGYVRVRPSYMAKCANSSAPTVSRHLKKLKDQGVIDVVVTREYSPESESWVSQTFVKPLADLSQPDQIVVPSEHGGNRRACKTCGSVKIRKVVTVHCDDCGADETTSDTPINPDAYEDDPELAEAEAAVMASLWEDDEDQWPDEDPQTNEAGPTNFILKEKVNTTQGERTPSLEQFVLSEFHDEIQTSPPPEPESLPPVPSVPLVSQVPINIIYPRRRQ